MEWQFSCERCRISFSNNSNISSGLEELCPSHASLQYFLNEPSNSSSPVFVGLSSMGRYDISTFMDILTDETSTSMNLMKVTSLLLNLFGSTYQSQHWFYVCQSLLLNINCFCIIRQLYRPGSIPLTFRPTDFVQHGFSYKPKSISSGAPKGHRSHQIQIYTIYKRVWSIGCFDQISCLWCHAKLIFCVGKSGQHSSV